MKMISPSFRFLLLLGACLTGWGCASPVSELKRPCPCSEGWTCCAQNQQCVQDATECPAVPGPTPETDTTAPSAPRLETVMSGSPTSQERVTVAGSAESHATVRLFDNPACGGQLLGEVKADSAGGFRVEVALAPNTTTALYGLAVDAAGNVSLCSAEPLRVTHDDQAPEAPALAETVPASPSATHLNPVLAGTAEPGALVRVFADAGCERALPFETHADTAGTFRVSVRVDRNTPTPFWARATDVAGNVSACSATSLSYTHDDVPPLAPAQVETVPASPSNASMEPLWKGLTEPGALVRVHAEEGCLGVPQAEVRADLEGRFGVRLTARANDSITRWVRVTDVAGNTSACYVLGTYVHDDIAPATPHLSWTTEPASPSNQTDSPVFFGYAARGTTVLLVEDSYSCSAEIARGPVNATTGAFRIQTKVGREDSSYRAITVRARALDAAGNLSPCSSATTYEYDITPPGPPSLAVLTGPSPSTWSTSVSLLVGSYFTGDTVRVYGNATCTGSVLGSSGSWEDFHTYVGLNLTPSSDTPLYVTVTDKAGNRSECFSTGLRYAHAPDGPGWRVPSSLPASMSGLAVDGQGHVFATALRRDTSPSRLMVWRSDETGAWGTGHVLSSTPNTTWLTAAVAANSRGDAASTWVEADGSQRVARYTPASGWGASEEVLPAGRRTGITVGVGVDAEGNALALWVEKVSDTGQPPYSDVVVSRSAAAGAEGWAQEARLPGSSLYDLRFVATPWGGLLLWRHSSTSNGVPDELHGRVYTHATGWSEERFVAPDSSIRALAVDAGGTVWLVTLPYTQGYGLWVRTLAPGATGWSEPERISPEGEDAYGAEVQVVGGRAGEALVVWSKSGSSNAPSQSWSRYHAPGGTWGELLPLKSSANLMRLAAGRDGEVYSVFEERFGPKPTGAWQPNEWLRLQRFTPAGGWEPQVQTLVSGSENVALYGVVGTSRGELLVQWKQWNGHVVPEDVSTRWLR